MTSIPQSGYVYLIRMGDTNYFKVGITSTSIDQRLSSLQTSTPFPLIRIASYHQINPRDVEVSIHQALRQIRVRNEWFQGDQFEIEQTFNHHNAMAEIDRLLRDDVAPNNVCEVIEMPQIEMQEDKQAMVLRLKSELNLGKNKIIEIVWGAKPGGTQAYKEASAIYDRIIQENDLHSRIN